MYTGGTVKVLSLQKSVLRSKLYSQFDTQTLSADGIQNDQTRATDNRMSSSPNPTRLSLWGVSSNYVKYARAISDHKSGIVFVLEWIG